MKTRKHWESLSDDQLLQMELSTDDPESLPNLVRDVPPGDDEVYVEFKYDMTKSGREEFYCVHGHHRHLKGFVMRKGVFRFMVGWQCGKTIYGEDFDKYTADFNAAVNRQVTLRRRRDIEQKTGPFMEWLEKVSLSGVFKLYASVRNQIVQRIPWIWENVPRAEHLGPPVMRVKFPATLFLEVIDPELEFGKVVAEMSSFAANLITQEEFGDKSVANIKRVLSALIRRIENVFEQLKEVEDFFQPSVLDAVCALANEHDNPKKRKYMAGLQSITCKRVRDKVTVQLPNRYALPDRSGLNEFKEALRVL